MFQMADNFQKSIDYRADNGEPWLKGQKVGIIGSGEFQVSRHINVATVQTPASFLEEPPRDMPADKRLIILSVGSWLSVSSQASHC